MLFSFWILTDETSFHLCVYVHMFMKEVHMPSTLFFWDKGSCYLKLMSFDAFTHCPSLSSQCRITRHMLTNLEFFFKLPNVGIIGMCHYAKLFFTRVLGSQFRYSCLYGNNLTKMSYFPSPTRKQSMPGSNIPPWSLLHCLILGPCPGFPPWRTPIHTL